MKSPEQTISQGNGKRQTIWQGRELVRAKVMVGRGEKLAETSGKDGCEIKIRVAYPG
jgi:hypothetical protein